MVMNIRYADEIGQSSRGGPVLHEKKSVNAFHHVSAATRMRVQQSKAKLGLKYQMLENYQRGYAVTTDDEKVPLNGVYNPLQVIRNREFRRQRMPYGPEGRRLGMWEVDPSEFVSDFAWIARNRHVMLDARRRPVYPEYPGSAGAAGHAHSHSHSHSHLHSHSHATSPDELVHHLKRKLTGQDGKPPSVAMHGASDSSSSLSEGPSQQQPEHDGAVAKAAVAATGAATAAAPPLVTVSRTNPTSSSLSLGSPLASYTSNVTTRSWGDDSNNGLRLSPPLEPVSTNISEITGPEPGPNASAVSVSVPGTDTDPQTGTTLQTVPQSGPSRSGSQSGPSGPSESTRYVYELKYLELVFRLCQERYELRGHPEKLEAVEQQLRDCAMQVLRNSNKVRDHVLPEVSSFYKETVSDVGRISNELENDKALKMESVMTEADRVISEVNTTLNLEIRRLNERLEKVHREGVKLRWLVNAGYSLLEYTVIGVMWVIWIFVFLLLRIRALFRLVFTVIRFLMWC